MERQKLTAGTTSGTTVAGPAAGEASAEPSPGGDLEGRIRAVGAELAAALGAVLDSLPGAPLRPNQLMAVLSVNRAVASKVLSATSHRDPMAALHQVPGPEPLRRLLRAAGRKGAPAEALARAGAAVADFDRLIRREAGTRPALDALLSASLPDARERFELASKYSVYKGMSQLKGVLAETWVGAAVVAPSAADPLKHDLTWLNGAVAIQRLRPGVTVHFSYRHRRDGPDRDDPDAGHDVVPLEQFCEHPPARLEAREAGGAIHYTLPDDLLGPRQIVDMFVVDHHPAAMLRTTDARHPRRNSLFVEPAIPVAGLVFDVILHEDAYPGAEPQLLIYDTGYDGIANVNDVERLIDRVDLRESVEYLGADLGRVQAAELPRYGEMLAHLAGRFGWDPGRFRAYRTRIQYPVYGWQVCLSFLPPTA
jgi:hypothetical protein